MEMKISALSNRYFVVTGFDFNEVVFSSDQNSYEFDNIAVGEVHGSRYVAGGIPEMSTWAMLLLGFASLGFGGYQRARSERAIA